MIADDCGGRIKGNRIDIRLPLASRSRLRRLGVRQMVVTVTPPAPKKKKGNR